MRGINLQKEFQSISNRIMDVTLSGFRPTQSKFSIWGWLFPWEPEAVFFPEHSPRVQEFLDILIADQVIRTNDPGLV